MGLMLSPELNGFLSMLGIPWPNIDEDEIKKDANAWRTVQAGAEPAGAQADGGIRRAQQAHRGDSAEALARHWNRVGGNEGHLAQAAAATRMAPVALDGTAAIVSAVKVAVGTQAVAGLTSVVQALAFTGGVGVAAATARMYLARNAMARVLREGAEGTGKVVAPRLVSKVTTPLYKILDDLRRPMGGTPALAGAGARVPVRTSGLRNPTGPRSVRDGMAQMVRRNNRDNSGGRGRGRGRGGGSSGGSSGGNWFRRDSTGKVHGELPNGTRGMSEEQGKAARDALRGSIRKRRQEQDRLGQEVGHEERIRREQEALRKIEEEGKRKKWW
ncbi:WXG100-like domain-containing protein [Nonomuraea gerenzanensis]|uniref:Rhs protein n=1 Tax=Nonomuraea gerenzanensis TaxID=93944 RepID=A0A1M4DW37_9ACTN|nr:hypothetical protein [Nonomuraea gerenzanensis]UBU13140.1 hypothetical protein LCN96_54380 [Nonomuraea gerenzanensis]SBO90786.1 Rhs protein [Nonomuraea gerenzanensis]